MKLTLFADYHQIHLLDANSLTNLADAWTVQATEDKVAWAGDMVGLGTKDADNVTVHIDVVGSAPTDDSGDWQHVTAASLRLPSGQLVAMGCTDYLPDAKRVAVAPGTWRLRTSHKGLSKGKETLRIQLWPAPEAPPVVEKRFVPPPPPAPKKKASGKAEGPKNAKAAAKLGRQGKTEDVLPALAAMSQAGDAAAAASAAEILAFKGQWAELVPHALRLLSNPRAVQTGNVFNDMGRLIHRAAKELEDPSIVVRAVAAVPAGMEPRRDAVVAKWFVPPSAQPGPGNLDAFAAAVTESQTNKRFAGKPDALTLHCFGLAVVFRIEDEIVARYDPGAPWADFERAVCAARVVARRGDGERAWSLLEPKLAQWYAVDSAQIAPVDLMADPWLYPIMTPERCARVLATPRAGETG